MSSFFHEPTVATMKSTAGEGFKFPKIITDFPERGKDEEVHTYTLGIKPDALFDFFDITVVGLSFSFHKKIFPPDASYVDNSKKHYNGGYPLVALTEKQAEFLQEMCDKKMKRISVRQNHDFDPDDTEKGPEFLQAKDVCVGECILLKRFDQFNPLDIEENCGVEKKIEEPRDETEAMENVIYEAQGGQGGQGGQKKGRKK